MLDAPSREALQLAAETADNHQPCGCYPAWIVAQTHPQAEHWATSQLIRSGFKTYLPLYAVMQRDRTLQTMKHLVHRPLFPGYCFVSISGSEWFAIRRSPGIKQVLLASYAKPHFLPPGSVEAIQASDPQRMLPQLAGASWSQGMACQLASGPFRDHPAVVLSVSPKSVMVAVLMFGHLRELAVAADCLKPRE